MPLVAMFLSGIVLYLIGSLMDRRERVRRERWWREFHEKTDPR